MTRNWLQLARDAYSASTSYVDGNYRKKWEDAIAMAQSRHPADSKYHSEAYKHRSKLFRPKTRSMIRKHEAAAASAFFSNVDVISTDAVDQGDQRQVASAAIMKEILNYRLQKTLPWFQIVTGGVQDAMTVGVVCSYQYWTYRAKMVKEQGETEDEFGQPQTVEFEREDVLEDRPCMELIPVENIRIDPGADWIDPIKSSPYVIRMIPMYMVDVREKMTRVDSKTGAPKWKKLTDGEIKSAVVHADDPTRLQRENHRQDGKDSQTTAIGDFDVVWVHENFMRLDGEEVVFYTLGTEFILTDTMPLEEVYFHGERPIVMGCAVIETHRVMPDSPAMLGEQLQREANEVTNQRMDNVKLVLNKRFFGKRGAQIDLKSLVRNVPGSVTLMNDPASDVKAVDFADVTSSSYAEQDRINVDYDELTGNFSQGSVMTNRRMNETVGGMQLTANSANQMTEYTIRTLTETWIEKALRQLVKLEQAYETDSVVLAIAADRAKLFQRFGIDQVTDDLLQGELSLTVNVGMGATDPQQKLQKFMGAVQTYTQSALGQAQLHQTGAKGVDMAEVGKEIFGLAGYRDGRRFLHQQDGEKSPEIAAAEQAVAQHYEQQIGQMLPQVQGVQEQLQAVTQERDQLKQTVTGKVVEAQSKAQESQVSAQIEAGKLQLQAQEQQSSEQIAIAGLQIKQAELALKEREMAIKERDQQLREAELLMQANAPAPEPAEPPEPDDAAESQAMAAVIPALQAITDQLAAMQQCMTMGKGMDDDEGEKTKEIVVNMPNGGQYKGISVDGKVTIITPTGQHIYGSMTEH